MSYVYGTSQSQPNQICNQSPSSHQPQDPVSLFHNAAGKLTEAVNGGLNPGVQGTDTNRVNQASHLRRSNAIGRGNSAAKTHHLDIAARSVSRASVSRSSSSASTSTLESRASDKDLPAVLRCLMSKGYSCATIGKYLVELLHGGNSFYSGLVQRLVEANCTYCEICVQVFRRLDLSNENGRPLEYEVETGNFDLKPDPTKPTKSLYSDDSEMAMTSPSHTLCRAPGTSDRLRQFSDVGDSEVEFVDVKMGTARMVDISRYPVHLVDSASASSRR